MTDTPDENATDDVFLTARFAGGRFNAHMIPFEVLPDLSAYRDLVIELAKKLYFDRHPDRKRVPKYFVASFQLGLFKVVSGNSATVYAKRVEERQMVPRFAEQGELGFLRFFEFDEARDLIDEFISAVAHKAELPARFPRELASRFNRFGQGLRDGEFVELSSPGRPSTVYNLEVRKNAVLSVFAHYENPIDPEETFTLDGGQDSQRLLHFKDADGRSFHFPASTPSQFDKAYSRRRQTVKLVGVGSYDRSDRLTKLISVDDIIYSDQEPSESFQERLNYIARIKPGWYEPHSPAPDARAIDQLRSFLELALAQVGIPTPYIYPTAEGGVIAEWTIGDWEVSATIGADSSALSFLALNVETDAEQTKEVNVSDPMALSVFANFWNGMDAD